MYENLCNGTGCFKILDGLEKNMGYCSDCMIKVADRCLSDRYYSHPASGWSYIKLGMEPQPEEGWSSVLEPTMTTMTIMPITTINTYEDELKARIRKIKLEIELQELTNKLSSLKENK